MPLPKFERRNVRKAALTVAKTGNGLDEALGFEPIALNVGDEIYLIVKARVFDIHHQAENRKNPGQDDLIRVHASDAIEVARITDEDAEPLLKAADARLAAFRLAASIAEEEASGIHRLPIVADNADQLVAEHEAGEHNPDLVDGCATCEEERDLAARGQ